MTSLCSVCLKKARWQSSVNHYDTNEAYVKVKLERTIDSSRKVASAYIAGKYRCPVRFTCLKRRKSHGCNTSVQVYLHVNYMKNREAHGISSKIALSSRACLTFTILSKENRTEVGTEQRADSD